MAPPQRRRFPTTSADLEWLITDDGSRTLLDVKRNETYHSGCGAVSETLIVYLENSGVAQRLIDRQPTAVLEYGLGTATGFLLTAALAESQQTKLDYWSLENRILPPHMLNALDLPEALRDCIARDLARKIRCESLFRCEQFAALRQLMDTLLAQLPDPNDPHCFGTHRIVLSPFVQLTLVIGDARDFTLEDGNRSSFDAIYFDAFSPASSPELWTQTVFQRAAAALSPAGRLTSYCVKRSVRKLIESSGLVVERVPGPIGGKREVLMATKPS